MFRLITSIVLILAIGLSFSCKKKKEEEPVITNNPITAPAAYDFTLSSFPNQTGYQWVYVNIITTTISIINGTNTSTNSFTNAVSYSLTITGDTLLPGGFNGKIWNNEFSSIAMNYKQVAYFDNSTNLFYILPLNIFNAPKAVSIKMPLVKGISWLNVGLSPQDSCKVSGVEQFYNGVDYFNVLNVERGLLTADKDYIKLNNKGIVYLENSTTSFSGNQITQIINKRILSQTNF